MAMSKTRHCEGRIFGPKQSHLIVLLLVSLLLVDSASAAVRLQRLGSTKANSQRGYDFYDTNEVKIGYSISNRRDGFNYYDGSGNKIGELKKPDKDKEVYTFYDASGIKKGILTKMPSGVYYYKDVQSGKLTDSIPQVPGRIGSLPPDLFQGKK